MQLVIYKDSNGESIILLTLYSINKNQNTVRKLYAAHTRYLLYRLIALFCIFHYVVVHMSHIKRYNSMPDIYHGQLYDFGKCVLKKQN